MEIITPLAQAAEPSQDKHLVGHDIQAAENPPEPDQFDAAMSDEGGQTADAEVAVPDQALEEFTGEIATAEIPQIDVIEEIMNRWSGVTSAFSEKTTPEQEYIPPQQVEASTLVEQDGAVIGAGENEGAKADGEDSQPKLPVPRPLAEAEPVTNQTPEPLIEAAQPASNVADADEVLSKPEKGTPPVSDPNLRVQKPSSGSDAENEAKADAADPGEKQEEGKPVHTDQRAVSPKGQPVTASLPLAQDTATSHNIRAGAEDFSGQSRNISEAAINQTANLRSETRLTVAPPPVHRQIADAIITASDKMVEVKLAPEELGRVRMILTGQDRSPHLTIWVERPETLEQMRRNGHSLLQDLQDSGLNEATVDFRDGRHDQPDAWAKEADDDDRDSWGANTIPENYLTPRLAATSYMMSGTRGIDIRV